MMPVRKLKPIEERDPYAAMVMEAWDKMEASMKDYREQIEAALSAQWKSSGIKTDWLAMETMQRTIFEGLAAGQYTQFEALLYLGESLEAFTRRGPVAALPTLEETTSAMSDESTRTDADEAAELAVYPHCNCGAVHSAPYPDCCEACGKPTGL